VANAVGTGGICALMSSPAAIRDSAMQFRSRSDGSFQINLCISNPPPVCDA
jgi:hypothetical protein